MKMKIILIAMLAMPLLIGVSCNKESEKNYTSVPVEYNKTCDTNEPIVYTFTNARATLVSNDFSGKSYIYIDNFKKPEQQKLPLLGACNMPEQYNFDNEGAQIIFSGYIHMLNDRTDYGAHPITLTDFKVKK